MIDTAKIIEFLNHEENGILKGKLEKSQEDASKGSNNTASDAMVSIMSQMIDLYGLMPSERMSDILYDMYISINDNDTLKKINDLLYKKIDSLYKKSDQNDMIKTRVKILEEVDEVLNRIQNHTDDDLLKIIDGDEVIQNIYKNINENEMKIKNKASKVHRLLRGNSLKNDGQSTINECNELLKVIKALDENSKLLREKIEIHNNEKKISKELNIDILRHFNEVLRYTVHSAEILTLLSNATDDDVIVKSVHDTIISQMKILKEWVLTYDTNK